MAKSRLVVPDSTVPGTRPWVDTLVSNGRRYADFTEKDVRPLVDRYRQLKEHEAWQVWLPDEPKTLERFCTEAFGYSAEFLETMDRGVQVLDGQGHEGPISEQQALAALKENGGDRRSAEFQSDNITLKDGGRGTSETYILRRLKRDRPDLAELVLDGKVTARAAGIAAGFIPRMASVPIDDPDRLAATLRRRLTPAALDRLRELLG